MKRKWYATGMVLVSLICIGQFLTIKWKLDHKSLVKHANSETKLDKMNAERPVNQINKAATGVKPEKHFISDVAINGTLRNYNKSTMGCKKVKTTQITNQDTSDFSPFDVRRQPRYKYGNVNKSPVMAVGIPTIKRMNESYLMQTLRSMIGQLKAVHREHCVFVVYIAEQDVNDFREVANSICMEFARDIDSGLLEIISPPTELYHKWQDKVHVNFGDSYSRSMWRSKQNLDAQFLISYVDHNIKSEYFLLMEDDVTASNDYMTSILQTVQSAQAPKGWLYYSFTSVGGAGKAFHAESLREFDAMLKIYWNHKPLDWILWDYTKTKVCGYDDKFADCKAKWKKIAVDYGKSLFLHKGKVSSKTNPHFQKQ